MCVGDLSFCRGISFYRLTRGCVAGEPELYLYIHNFSAQSFSKIALILLIVLSKCSPCARIFASSSLIAWRSSGSGSAGLLAFPDVTSDAALSNARLTNELSFIPLRLAASRVTSTVSGAKPFRVHCRLSLSESLACGVCAWLWGRATAVSSAVAMDICEPSMLRGRAPANKPVGIPPVPNKLSHIWA